MYKAEIIADSLHPEGGRLTTFVLRYPRYIHSEVMTYRLFSRNSASSRAIPAKKLRAAVLSAPATPVFWGLTQKGMQADVEATGLRKRAQMAVWYGVRYAVAAAHWTLEKLRLHKQLVNRIIEPWMWIEVVLTGTDEAYDWLFHQRVHPDAQPEFRHLAEMMLSAYRASKPAQLEQGEVHVPWHPPEHLNDLDVEEVKATIGRVARISYLTHENDNTESNIKLYEKLAKTIGDGPGHYSPLEHVAVATSLTAENKGGNFGPGWIQWRKTIERKPPRADSRFPARPQ